jgi:hypothetical protein
MSKKKSNVIEMPIEDDPETLLCGALHDMCRRIEGAQKIVLELAKKDPELHSRDITEMIWAARRYVFRDMKSEVGVRKMAREKWGMT